MWCWFNICIANIKIKSLGRDDKKECFNSILQDLWNSLLYCKPFRFIFNVNFLHSCHNAFLSRNNFVQKFTQVGIVFKVFLLLLLLLVLCYFIILILSLYLTFQNESILNLNLNWSLPKSVIIHYWCINLL